MWRILPALEAVLPRLSPGFRRLLVIARVARATLGLQLLQAPEVDPLAPVPKGWLLRQAGCQALGCWRRQGRKRVRQHCLVRPLRGSVRQQGLLERAQRGRSPDCAFGSGEPARELGIINGKVRQSMYGRSPSQSRATLRPDQPQPVDSKRSTSLATSRLSAGEETLTFAASMVCPHFCATCMTHRRRPLMHGRFTQAQPSPIPCPTSPGE